MDLRNYSSISNTIKEKLMNDSFTQQLFFQTSFVKRAYTYEENQHQYFIKELDSSKINKVFSGNYQELYYLYYEKISKLISCVNVYELFEINYRLFEVQDKIEEKRFLSNHSFSWHEILVLFHKINSYIDYILSENQKTDYKLGLDTSIWNFTIDGLSFDFSPPKMITYYGDEIFCTKTKDHYERTYYRSFDPLGMRLNLAVTLIKIIESKELIIPDKPNNWKAEVVLLLKENLSYKQQEEVDNVLNSSSVNEDEIYFYKHPLILLKKMVTSES